MRAALEGALLFGVLRARHHKALRVIACQLLTVALAGSALLACNSVPVGQQQEAARAAEVTRLSLRASSLPPWTFFFALNLYNSADILPQFTDQLLVLADVLGEPNVYISIWENGSRDGTKAALRDLARVLTQRRIRHSIVTGDTSWWDLCPLLGSPGLRAACSECEYVALRDCVESVRIPVMALIRNLALLPLFNVSDVGGLYAKAAAAAANAATAARGSSSKEGRAALPSYAADHLGFSKPTQVVFLNDVILYAGDVIELLATETGRYDLACGMDYDELQLYDVWVARDLNGASLSGWHPHVRERAGQERLLAGQPFRVYSCWNGAVALPAAALVSDGLLFRSWEAGEPRSLRRDADPRLVWSDACPASECHLICKDLWRAGRTRIFMNPRVRLAYNYATELKQRVWLPLLNTLLLGWSNRIGAGHHALRSPRVRWPVGSTHAANEPVAAASEALPACSPGERCLQPVVGAPHSDGGPAALLEPPRFVSCGLSDEDLLPFGFKQNLTTERSARRTQQPTTSVAAA